jgi:hypothetical protein
MASCGKAAIRSRAFGHASAVWRNYRTRACPSCNPPRVRSRWTGLAGDEMFAPSRLGTRISAGFLVSVRLVDSPARGPNQSGPPKRLQSLRTALTIRNEGTVPTATKALSRTPPRATVPPGLATTSRSEVRAAAGATVAGMRVVCCAHPRGAGGARCGSHRPLPRHNVRVIGGGKFRESVDVWSRRLTLPTLRALKPGLPPISGCCATRPASLPPGARAG